MEKIFTHITRASQLFLLVVVMVANSLANHAVSYDSSFDTEQSTETQAADSTDNDTTVSELSIQSLAPSHAFSFDNQVYILPTQQIANWHFSVINYLPRQLSGYFTSYFANIFERLIAINAP